MTELNDETVAQYIGCTAGQVRVMRIYREHGVAMTCEGCGRVHDSYPKIVAYHSPCCEAQGKCRMCGSEIPGLLKGHEVGLICGACYGDSDPRENELL